MYMKKFFWIYFRGVDCIQAITVCLSSEFALQLN